MYKEKGRKTTLLYTVQGDNREREREVGKERETVRKKSLF